MDAELKVLDLTGPLTVSRRYLEDCRGDFIAIMGMTPEEWEAYMVESIGLSREPSAPTSADSSAAPDSSPTS